jgi:pimeloyl-ACP methyl ester carboxylesterase
MFADIEGKKIYYEIAGTGPAIIWVHGWGGSSKSLRALHDQASKNFTSILIDLPGFGQSQNPPKDWGVIEYAKIVTDFIESFGYSKINYFGHSFGGSLGVYIASHTNLIEKLILCAPSYKRMNKKHWITKIPAYSIFRIIINPFRKILYRILCPKSDTLRFPQLESNYRKITQEDLSEFVKDINCHKLILWGSKDLAVPVKHAYELKKTISNSTLKVFEGYKHSLPLVVPVKVYRELKSFIEK